MRYLILISFVLFSAFAFANSPVSGSGTHEVKPVYFLFSGNTMVINFNWWMDIESNNSDFVTLKNTDGSFFSDISPVPSPSKKANNSLPVIHNYQIPESGALAGMKGILIFTVILAGVVLMGKLGRP